MPAWSKTLAASLAGGLLLAGPAWAEPPGVGTTHTFLDPIFEGTVVCDTLEAVTEIAMAEDPDQIYAGYVMTANAIGEPVCLAIVPTAEVKSVQPLGTMFKGEDKFNAWAVEAEVEGQVVYALYLERDPSILV